MLGARSNSQGVVDDGHLVVVVSLHNPLSFGVGEELDETVALMLSRDLLVDDFDEEELVDNGPREGGGEWKKEHMSRKKRAKSEIKINASTC